MPELFIIYGDQNKSISVEPGSLLGDAIAQSGLPLEQPCAGRGTCGKCKVLVEDGVSPPDEIERDNLTTGELTIGNRLACRARITADATIVLSPIVVYSNKSFRAGRRYKREKDVPLGLAIDLGTTTVAAFLTMLDTGEVCAGAASLNQQTVFGADVISRMNAAREPETAQRLHRLALASIGQSIDALKLSARIRQRIERVTVVGNVAMHHLLSRLPINTLMVRPFQPFDRRTIQDASPILGGIFPSGCQIALPPLVGGFVGSDALACLSYFGFDEAQSPMLAIDLGTNGEVLLTDGNRIVTASTAAGPAFEGVNISCGSRAVDGAVVDVSVSDGEIILETIGDVSPIGLTGSGLLSAIHELRQAGIIEPSGRISRKLPDQYRDWVKANEKGIRSVCLTPDADLRITQIDVRELQKAKGAIRAAVNILMNELDLVPDDLERVVLTGSFGGQVDIDAVIELGMIPPVDRSIVETVANGAGFGAALFLSDEGFALGEKLAKRAEQIDLDTPDFQDQYINALSLIS